MKFTSFTTTTIDRFQEHHVQDSLTKLTDKLYIDFTALTGEAKSIVIYGVFNNNAYRFVFEDLSDEMIANVITQTPDNLADFMGEATSMILNKEYEEGIVSDTAYNLVKIILQSINGELAEIIINNYNNETDEETGDTPADNEPDPNLIYVQLVNGQLYTIPRDNVNWDETISNLNSIAAFQGTIKQMIFDLFRAPDTDIETVKMRIREIIQKETTNTGMTHDYSVFENLTEKEEILLYLFDINTVYEQIILIAATMDAQQQIMKALNNITNGGNNEEVVDVDSETV